MNLSFSDQSNLKVVILRKNNILIDIKTRKFVIVTEKRDNKFCQDIIIKILKNFLTKQVFFLHTVVLKLQSPQIRGSVSIHKIVQCTSVGDGYKSEGHLLYLSYDTKHSPFCFTFSSKKKF